MIQGKALFASRCGTRMRTLGTSGNLSPNVHNVPKYPQIVSRACACVYAHVRMQVLVVWDIDGLRNSAKAIPKECSFSWKGFSLSHKSSKLTTNYRLTLLAKLNIFRCSNSTSSHFCCSSNIPKVLLQKSSDLGTLKEWLILVKKRK